MPIRVRAAPAPAPVVLNTRVMRRAQDSSDDDDTSDEDKDEEADVEDLVERKTSLKKSANGRVDHPPRKRRRSHSTDPPSPSRAEFDALKANFEQYKLANEGLKGEVAELRGMFAELKQIVESKAAVDPAPKPAEMEVEVEAPQEPEKEREDEPMRDLPPDEDVDSSDLTDLDEDDGRSTLRSRLEVSGDVQALKVCIPRHSALGFGSSLMQFRTNAGAG